MITLALMVLGVLHAGSGNKSGTRALSGEVLQVMFDAII